MSVPYYASFHTRHAYVCNLPVSTVTIPPLYMTLLRSEEMKSHTKVYTAHAVWSPDLCDTRDHVFQHCLVQILLTK